MFNVIVVYHPLANIILACRRSPLCHGCPERIEAVGISGPDDYVIERHYEKTLFANSKRKLIHVLFFLNVEL